MNRHKSQYNVYYSETVNFSNLTPKHVYYILSFNIKKLILKFYIYF